MPGTFALLRSCTLSISVWYHSRRTALKSEHQAATRTKTLEERPGAGAGYRYYSIMFILNAPARPTVSHSQRRKEEYYHVVPLLCRERIFYIMTLSPLFSQQQTAENYKRHYFLSHNTLNSTTTTTRKYCTHYHDTNIHCQQQQTPHHSRGDGK